MSRREGREFDSRRHRSKYDREPSPKRYRRDGKPATERKPSNFDVDLGDHPAHEPKQHRRRLQDAVPLEAPLLPDMKGDSGPANKESDKHTDGQNEGTINSSNPTEIPRSRSYFQHDERGSAYERRSRAYRTTSERGWRRDSKVQNDDRVPSRTASLDMHQKGEKSQAVGEEDKRVWRHDGFYEMEANPPPPPSVRKRPAFREKKIQPVETKDTGRVTTEPSKSSHFDRPTSGSERREDREGHREDREGRVPHSFERPERPFARERPPPNSERHNAAGGDYRARERFNGGRQQGARPAGNRAERWKHDMYAEANRSPTPKNEEDQIAKVEALLAS